MSPSRIERDARRMLRTLQYCDVPSSYLSTRAVVTYIGAAASVNLGDVLLFEGARTLLSPLRAIPNTPTSSFKSPAVRGILKTVGQLLMRGVSTPRATILGGGTLLRDGYFHGLVEEYHAAGEPFFVFGTAVESAELLGDDCLHNIVPTLLEAELIGVRDPYARRELASHGVDAEVIGDLALATVSATTRSLGDRPLRVGVNVGTSRGPMQGEQSHVNDVMVDYIRELLGRGVEVTPFAMHDFDREEIREIARRTGIDSESLWADYGSTPSFMRMLDSLDLVVGERLHAAILATGCGIPTISVGYRPKCAHYMESIDASEYCTSTADVTIDWLLERTDSILADFESVSTHLVEATDRLRSAQRDFAARLVSRVS